MRFHQGTKHTTKNIQIQGNDSLQMNHINFLKGDVRIVVGGTNIPGKTSWFQCGNLYPFR